MVLGDVIVIYIMITANENKYFHTPLMFLNANHHHFSESKDMGGWQRKNMQQSIKGFCLVWLDDRLICLGELNCDDTV